MPELPKLLELIQKLLSLGNIAQAEILCQMGIEAYPEDPNCHFLLGRIAMSVKHPSIALRFFLKAQEFLPSNQTLKDCLAAIEHTPEVKPVSKSSRFLLVKAWGYGFWSDVDHILGQLLVAEITGRVPIIHWGKNSLYGDHSAEDHFTHYFEPVSRFTIHDVMQDGFDYFPKKWNRSNLLEEDINKFDGPWSCMAALYGYSRNEQVLVSDFYTRILNIVPWLPAAHEDFGKTVDEIYRRLIKTYLRPKKRYLLAAKEFVGQSFGNRQFLAIHMRGTDKVLENAELDLTNQKYFERIDTLSSDRGALPIFLMTDDLNLLEYFENRYPNKVISSDSTRTDGDVGLHKQASANGKQLGEEILLDTYIALHASVFIGNGFSNPSAMIGQLRDWKSEDIFLLDEVIHHQHNITLHMRPIEALDPNRAALVWSLPKAPGTLSTGVESDLR